MNTIIKFYQNIIMVYQYMQILYYYMQILYYYISGNNNKKLDNDIEKCIAKSNDVDFFFDNEYIPDNQGPLWF